MKIEITTASKKLTKSIINQMRIAPDNVIKNGTVLGYLINAVKNTHKSILIEHENEYYRFSAAWIKGERSVYRNFARWSQTKNFDDAKSCDSWWDSYQIVLSKAITQIYI